jgi:hypothetical protein
MEASHQQELYRQAQVITNLQDTAANIEVLNREELFYEHQELDKTIKMLKDIFKDMNIDKYQDSWSLMKEDKEVPNCLRNPESDLDDDDDDDDDDEDEDEDEDIGIGCNDCYACVSGGSKPCQKHPPLK